MGLTFSDAVDSGIGREHFLLLIFGILLGQQTWKWEREDSRGHSDD